MLGVSVFAVLDMPLEELLRQRFANFRSVYLLTVAGLAGVGSLLDGPAHFTIRLLRASDTKLRLLTALGDPGPIPYAKSRDLA